MKRLIRLVLISVIVLALLCGGAIILGHRQPEVSILAELKPCGDSLCYLGIVPGKTRWDEGMAIIHQSSQFQGSADNLTFEHFDPSYIVVFSKPKMGNDDVYVFDKIVIYPNAPPPVGNIVAVLGIPCYVASFGNGMDLAYPNVVIHLPPNYHLLTPTWPVSSITLQPATEQSCTKMLSNDLLPAYKWRGFTVYH